MFWKVSREEAEVDASTFTPAGRYVIHRHVDAQGEHLDLRLEMDGHLRGWRIDAADFERAAWATEKAPHPMRWLDEDGEARRVDAGEYAWERQTPDGGALLLRGASGDARVRVEPAPELPVAQARAIAETLSEQSTAPCRAAGLIVDGIAARSRATERLCGLARELDGDAFSESLTRRMLNGLTLDDIHGQLRTYERRFDTKYPPLPVSRPDTDEGIAGERAEEALAIVRE